MSKPPMTKIKITTVQTVTHEKSISLSEEEVNKLSELNGKEVPKYSKQYNMLNRILSIENIVDVTPAKLKIDINE